jgi:hypothetical protein
MNPTWSSVGSCKDSFHFKNYAKIEMGAMKKKIYDTIGTIKSDSIRGTVISKRNDFRDDLSSVSKRS